MAIVRYRAEKRAQKYPANATTSVHTCAAVETTTLTDALKIEYNCKAVYVVCFLTDADNPFLIEAQKRETFLATIQEIEQRVEKLLDIAKRPKVEHIFALQQLAET